MTVRPDLRMLFFYFRPAASSNSHSPAAPSKKVFYFVKNVNKNRIFVLKFGGLNIDIEQKFSYTIILERK